MITKYLKDPFARGEEAIFVRRKTRCQISIKREVKRKVGERWENGRSVLVKNNLMNCTTAALSTFIVDNPHHNERSFSLPISS